MDRPAEDRERTWQQTALPHGRGLRPLPARFWSSPEVAEAAAHGAPGTIVALARQAHGLSQSELGALAGFSQSAVSRLEAGGNLGFDLRVLRSFQRLLGVPPQLLGLSDEVAPLRTSDAQWLFGAGGPSGEDGVGAGVQIALDRGALLDACEAAIVGPSLENLRAWDPDRPTDPDAVHRLLVVRRLVNESDYWLGPRSLAPAVEELYRLVDRMRRAAHGGLRRRLLDVTALYAEFYGWLCQELGDLRGAGEWTQRALQQAQAAEDRELVAYSYIRLAQLAQADKDDDGTIGLARAALREEGLSPRVQAMALQQEAHGHAMAGNAEACLRKLEEAYALNIPDTPQFSDAYLVGYYFDGNHLAIQHAACLLELGRAREAIARYEEHTDSRGLVCRWEQAVHAAKLARAYALTGDVDRAATLGGRALELGRGTGSTLVREELLRLSAWERTPAIAGLTAGARQLA
jgi:transcriptional regulator with XRE-family HTH domain